MIKIGHPASHQLNRHQPAFDWMFLFFANALSDCCRTWTGTRRRMWCVCLSRSVQEPMAEQQHNARTRSIRSNRTITVREGRKKFPWDPLPVNRYGFRLT